MCVGGGGGEGSISCFVLLSSSSSLYFSSIMHFILFIHRCMYVCLCFVYRSVFECIILVYSSIFCLPLPHFGGVGREGGQAIACLLLSPNYLQPSDFSFFLIASPLFQFFLSLSLSPTSMFFFLHLPKRYFLKLSLAFLLNPNVNPSHKISQVPPSK